MQTLFAGAWQSQIFSEGLPLMTRTSNVEPQCSPGAIEVLVEGSFPPQLLQDKVSVYPMLSGKGHVSFR